MPHEYDQQVLESVHVRRQRLRAALLRGVDAHRGEGPTGLRGVLAGLTAAAVLATGCVGYSFVVSLLPQLARTSAAPAPGTPR